mmetsp:Transcript_30789/g.51868  ORF Transcript_30789/g.51868 Transcript_30789/m.51868 type:complete len:392 (-) Transcript_30789:174-1349(-)|eukprot:CAMPEP_0184343478 /NCGR_PEP_ID=MMETSP1089-20130417/11996_1 /TAXON_ID=38269 ORGANISM="Gloeochaete wittrockiana, Strain SAG46.84" /NCGR_SAMPLE_ID=MMETSP1089 /ASSEMBLY_ACC=CAM_ASM_000445 /LENGTH=391 /DNA_ID=CAMNT_0026672787 /DNA_START=80 /DNA_END=1255 /DNA_ORIENTATION=+
MEALAATYRKLLSDPTYSDLTLKVGKDEIKCHRFVVAIRCEAILPLPDFNDKKKKIKDKQVVQIKEADVTAKEMQKVLEYLYTGDVAFPADITNVIRDILLLNKAAKAFQLRRLSYKCEQWLRDHMAMENIFHILKAAHDLQEPTVGAFAKNFALSHYNEFVTNKNGLHVLGLDLFQEVVTAFQTFSASGGPGTPTIGEPENTYLTDLKKMHDLMPFSDLRFNFDGDIIPCHRSFLGACSDKFKIMLRDKEIPAAGIPPSRAGLNAESFRQMLRFLYYGDDRIDPLPACELVGYARELELQDLIAVCEYKIRNSIAVDTVVGILEVAYSEMSQRQELVEELKSKAFPFIMDHFTEIDLSKLRKNPRIAQDLLLRVQEHQRKRKRGGTSSRR